VTIQGLEKDKSALYEVLWYLQNTTPESAGDLLDQLRSTPGSDVGAMVRHFAQHRRSAAYSEVAERASSGSTTNASKTDGTAPTTTGSGPNSLISKPNKISQLLDARGRVVLPNEITSPETRNEFATVFHLEEPLQWFHGCVGALFYIMNPDEVSRSIELLKQTPDAHVPLGDLVSARRDVGTATLAAELAGMASIGMVHANLADPVNSPPAELADYFYAVAKMGLDAAIQHSLIRAVKISALVAMYNIVVHATVSLAYLGAYPRRRRSGNTESD